MADMERLGALAASFEARAERANSACRYTRSGYLSRDSVGLVREAIAFETAARELRAVLVPPTPEDDDDAS